MEEWQTKAAELREHRSFNETMAFLLSVLQEHPQDPRVYYQIGCTHEILGESDGSVSDAVGAYERALELGLKGEEQRQACLSLGNIHRVLGNLERSREILRQGLLRFPTYRPFHAFLALTLHDLGENREAVKLLLDLVVETSGDKAIRDHEESLSFYALRLGAP